jgi:glycosyltransferase involved in cell wall biosynthesis
MKVLYIISLTSKSTGFEKFFLELKSKKIDFHVLLINNQESELFRRLSKHNISVSEYYYAGKKSILKLIYLTVKKIKQVSPTHVHAHLLEGGFIGGIASWIARVPNRIYTRHHGDTHYYEKKHGKIYDKLIHFFYHKIICLCNDHLRFLKEVEKINASKLFLVHNFVDPKIFEIPAVSNQKIKEKYHFDKKNINIGINARWVEWKGVHYILEAILNLIEHYPRIKVYLFNAKGDYTQKINELLERFNPGIITKVEFESDIMAVYSNFSIFIHCPIRYSAESFGLVYVEALGSGIPCIFTLSGIANDIVVNNDNALVVDFVSTHEIQNAIETLIQAPLLREKLSQNAKEIKPFFSIEKHINELLNVYQA